MLDQAVIDDILRRLKSDETLHGYEARLRCKDGSIRYASINSSVYREDGRFVHTRCVTLDVTGKKEAVELQERLAAIVSSSDDAIISKSLDGIILSWNRGAERIFGYKAQEVIGKHVSMLAAPECIDEIPAILGRVSRGESVDHYETKRKTKDGRQYVQSERGQESHDKPSWRKQHDQWCQQIEANLDADGNIWPAISVSHGPQVISCLAIKS